MKKSLLLIALAGLMTLAACKKDKESQGEAKFTATIEHQGGKTSFDPNNGHINWTAGDQIVISNADNETAVFNLQSGEGTTEGGFGTSDEFTTVGPFIAAYPSTAEIEGNTATFNLPDTQAIGETGTFANGANPMIAYSDDKTLQFKNLCGGLGIRLKGVGTHVSAVRITSKNTTEKLWGAYEVSNCSANEPTLTVASGNQGSNVITITCDVTLTTAAKTFIVMLPPGTLANGFEMEVLDGEQVLATKETTSNVGLIVRNSLTIFNDILIDMEFDGNVEIPAGMSGSDIIVTNFGEDAIPDENGDYAIGYSKMLVAKNADNNEPIYFALYSTDFSISKGVLDNADYQLSAKETALYLALSVFPNGLGELPDNKFHKLKDILYTLDCVQQLELAVQQSVNQYGYLNEDVFDDALEVVRIFFYNELIAPTFGDESRSGIDPPFANHWGNLAKIEIHSSTYNANDDSWDIQTTCWNGMGICVGLVEGSLFDASSASYHPEAIVSYLKPTLVSDVFSMDEIFSWQHYVDIYNEVSRALHGTNGGFSTIGVSRKDVSFNLNPEENAIFYIGPNYKDVEVVNFLYLGFQTVKFIVSQLVGSSTNEMFNDVLMSSEMVLDDQYVGMIATWDQTHDRELFRTIFFETLRKMGVFWLNHGFFYDEHLTKYNEYTAMLSAVAYACDLYIGYKEFTNYQTIGLEVGGGHQRPMVGCVGYFDVTATSARVVGIIGNEGAHPVVERGFEWSCIDPQGNAIGGDVVVGSGSGMFSYQFEDLYPNTMYSGLVWARQELGGQKYYSDNAYYEFTTLPDGGGNGSYNGHEYVDLGLPSGLLWATCNVGANVPEEYGDYFAWGEIQWKSDDAYEWGFYQHCKGSYNTLTKYCNNSNYGYNGFTDELTILLPEDDAATINWGDGWHIPTKEEWQELLNNTTNIWTTQNGVNGRLFTASNGNNLFLPASGWIFEPGEDQVGGAGFYRSSSLNTDQPFGAWDFGFRLDYNPDVLPGIRRYAGISIRPVHPVF